MDKVRIKLALLASGSGTNAENISLHFKNHPDIEVSLIASNKKDAFVLERAQKLNVDCYTFNRKEMEEGDLVAYLLKKGIDFIVLAGFLLRIPAHLIKAFPNRIINIHPALLPNYGGKGMFGMHVHQAVKEAGDNESGISIHYVNEHYDEGQILFQAKCPVSTSDSAEDIAEKVHTLEYAHFPKVIEQAIRKVFFRDGSTKQGY